MKLLASLLIATIAFAQDAKMDPKAEPAKVVQPKPIDTGDQEAYSRVLLSLQSAYINLQATPQQRAFDEANSVSQVKLAELRKKYGAGDNCTPSMLTKEWLCAPVPAPASHGDAK